MSDNNRVKLSDEEMRKIRRTIKRVPAKNISQTNMPKGRAGGRNKPSSRRFNQTHVIMICLAVLLIVSIVIAIVLIQKPKKSNDLTGRWSLDDVTVYSFDDNGRGEMVLPLNTYEFSYVVEGDKIKIDFINENAEDREYSYLISSDTLTMVGADGTEYRFTKNESLNGQTE